MHNQEQQASELQSIADRVSMDLTRLVLRSQVDPILVSLGGSRRWGYHGSQSDKDVSIVFDNRSEYDLYNPYEKFLFSTGDGYNYTGYRIDKLLQRVATSNVGSLEILTAPVLIEDSSTAKLVESFLPDIYAKLNYRHILSSFKGMLVADIQRVKSAIAKIDHNNHATYQALAKVTLTMCRCAINVLYYRQGLVHKNSVWYAGPIQDFMMGERVYNFPQMIAREIEDLIEYRNYTPTSAPNIKTKNVIFTAEFLLEWAGEEIRLEPELIKTMKDIPKPWDVYSGETTLNKIMSNTNDTEYSSAHNHVLGPLQQVVHSLYTAIQMERKANA